MNERAERIKKLIEESGKTYQELEKITGVAKSSLQRYASGVTNKIPLEVVDKLEKAFNVPRGYIMGWVSEETSKKNDQIASLVIRMRKDSDFLAVASMLAELPAEQFDSVKTILSALGQK